MSQERRQHERVSILAQVQLTRDHEVDILTATNLSVGGAFLEAVPDEHPQYAIGSCFELALSMSEDAPGHAVEEGIVHAFARIVRQETAGFGVQFDKIDEENLGRLQLMLSRAKAE
jgi:hypothetical protein